MSKLKKAALRILYLVNRAIARTRLWVGRTFGLIRSVMIVPYQGFGNENEMFFPGRVLRDRGIGISSIEDSKWINFKRMYKRFITWKIPDVRVKASFDDVSRSTVTDEEGYFEFHIKMTDPAPVTIPWQEIHLELVDQVLKKQETAEAVTKIFISSGKEEYGIISDIDDTIVPTGATRIWEMLKTTFLENAHSRIPFPGVAAFYQALSKGVTGSGINPVFYVSSSPWNLYDFLTEFMDINNIPKGPLLLRDIGLSKKHLFSGSHIQHKLTQVERIFNIIADIPFILIGDSGQHDAEIYQQVVRDFPGRVKMIYIRDVDPARHQNVSEIAMELKKSGIELKLVKDTVEAARHAVSMGWITEGIIGDVAKDKQEDEDQ